ncbi:RNA polymerase sigma factor [Lentzea sp. NBRC 105346]|uniref:RNA polymerase sigma factor n=1 Tax=Lentzea sp. NBRC 105346 TaxID=3032205 RepID=UPI0024A564D4|nr:sigma-70 family RNA polymerase sigma factor [Lentzea sp. NBRC 105346]GLZ29028.1 RNA polymerase sigma factor [Lentzea sp. NBRC 105346]
MSIVAAKSVVVSDDNGALLAAAARGHQASWNELVRRYNSLLWSIARSFRLSTQDASDVVQNTWLRLVENLDRIRDPERLGAWLGTAARRECLQHLRRNARHTKDVPAEGLAELADEGPGVDASLLLEERDAELWLAVSKLSDRCAQLLRVLMASPPPSYADVAEILGMPVGSIGPNRIRCLEHLRKLVGP